MIDWLIRYLAAGSRLTAEEIMDILWLSAIRPLDETSAAAAPRPEQASPPSLEELEPPSSEPPDTERQPAPTATPDSPVQLHLGGEQAGGHEQVPATEIGFGAPRPIRDPLALPRALRRLKQIRAPGHRTEVDIDATVEATAEAGRLVIVSSHPLERALDLALVIDGSPAMRIWDETFDEFERLLVQTGAFRSVSRWHLISQADGVSLSDPQGTRHPARRLVDPSGNRLVLIATDASDQHWYAAELWEAVAAWCAAMPTALIQVLPHHYWAGTALGDPYVAARARGPPAPIATTRGAWPGGPPTPGARSFRSCRSPRKLLTGGHRQR